MYSRRIRENDLSLLNERKFKPKQTAKQFMEILMANLADINMYKSIRKYFFNLLTVSLQSSKKGLIQIINVYQ